MVMAMSEILTPFLAALILAYILEPLKLRLIRLKVPETLAVFITMLIGITISVTIFLLLLKLIQHELPLIKVQFPIWLKDIQGWIEPTLAKFDVTLDWADIREQATTQITSSISDNANTLATTALGTIVRSSGSLLGFMANLVLTLFIVFFLLLEWDQFFSMLGELIPVKYRNTLIPLIKEVDSLLSEYLTGQLTLMGVLAIFYGVGLSVIGLNSALPLGAFTGFVTFIPYIGFAISFILSLLSALLQFGPENHLLAVLALYGCGQLLEGFYLTPRLVGERIGLHPVAVVFALLVFGKIFGFLGILLALPMSAISLVAIRFIKLRYTTSEWFKRK